MRDRTGRGASLLLALTVGVVGCTEPPASPRSAGPGELGARIAFSTYLGRGTSTLRAAAFDRDGNLYVAGGTEGLLIFDITKPLRPTQLARVRTTEARSDPTNR